MPWLAPTRRRRADTSQRTHDFRIDLACVYARRLETMRSSPLIHLDATRSPHKHRSQPCPKACSQRESSGIFQSAQRPPGRDQNFLRRCVNSATSEGCSAIQSRDAVPHLHLSVFGRGRRSLPTGSSITKPSSSLPGEGRARDETIRRATKPFCASRAKTRKPSPHRVSRQ